MSATANDNRERRFWRAQLWFSAAVCLAAFVFLFVGPLAGLLQSFETLESSQAPTPDMLAAGVRTSTISTLVGVASGLVGVTSLVLSLIKLSRTRDPAS